VTFRSSRAVASSAVLAATVVAGVVMALLVARVSGDSSPTGERPPAALAAASEPSAAQPPQSFSVDAKPAVPASSQLDDARPRLVRLPSGTEVPLQPSATSGKGLLQVPDGIGTAGWWDGGARLGERYGAMLVAGHVDSRSQGLGPFAELLDAQRGQLLDVTAGGSGQRFSVVGVEVVSAGALGDRPDLFSQEGPLRLVLVTCAGPFVESHGGYQNRVIVTARPEGPPTATRRSR
jgi:hypothetical protein